MIMNKVGGGGSGGGVTTRTVGLGEIFFYYGTRSEVPNYRVILRDKGDSAHIFYFPGKVLQILSFKYRYSSGPSSAFGSVETYTGEWTYFGNMASPSLSTPSSSSGRYYYAVTELTAIIEDEATGGQVQTITISADDLYDGKRVKLPSNVISVSGLTSSAAIPSGTDSKAALIKEMKITGSLLYVKGVYDAITLNVKLATTSAQGILMAVEEYYSSGGSAHGIVFYPGFKPKYVAFSKVVDSYPGNGVISGNWHDTAAPVSFGYNRVIYADGNSTNRYDVRAAGLSCEYTESTGEAYLHYSASYGISTSGTFEIVAIG